MTEVPRTSTSSRRRGGAVALGQMLQVWEREARSYLELAPKLPARTPRCDQADGEHESGIDAMLLEHLSPSTCGRRLAGADAAQAEAAVQWLPPTLVHADFRSTTCSSTPDSGDQLIEG